jgi:hypothetical protein
MKFQARQVNIDAIQWIGYCLKDYPKLRINDQEIVQSIDGKLFYYTGCNCENWLSIEKGEDGKYACYPFTEWKIRSDAHRISKVNCPHLVQLYLDTFNLQENPLIAYLGENLININDWIVKEPDGEIRVMNTEKFNKLYENKEG